MTHKDEICYWAEHPDDTPVWYRDIDKTKWETTTVPIWEPDAIYIVDNEWAELRKAQADGHQLEVYIPTEGWQDEILDYYWMDGNITKAWRIKQEKFEPNKRIKR